MVAALNFAGNAINLDKIGEKMRTKLTTKLKIIEVNENKTIFIHQIINQGKNNQWSLNIPSCLKNHLKIHHPYKITIEKQNEKAVEVELKELKRLKQKYEPKKGGNSSQG